MRARRAAALAVLVAAVAATAQAEPPVIDAMAVRITVGRDGTLSVGESIDVAYTKLGTLAFRIIALRAPDGGLVRVRDVEASDGADGAAVPVGVTERPDELEIRPRGPLTLTHESTLQLRLAYTMYRALRSDARGDRLDLVVLPKAWTVRVERLRVEVHFPASMPVKPALHAALTRPDGTPVPANVVHGHRRIRLEAPRPARPGESARLTVVWPSGHVNLATPEPPARWPPWVRLTEAWFVPGGLLLLTGLIWITGRARGRAVVPSYAPPAGLRPGEAGVVIDGRIDPDDVVAAVVDLAGRGYLTLERAAGETDVMVTVRREWISDPDVRPWEAVLLANVFSAPGYRRIALSALRAPHDSASIREALSADLAVRGLFASPPLAIRRVGRWAAVVTTAIWLQLAFAEGADGPTKVAGVATGMTIWLLTGVVAAGGLTAEGRRARSALRGFRDFLARVDTGRLERLPAGTLDENLPWAIALGVTDGWLTTASRGAVGTTG